MAKTVQGYLLSDDASYKLETAEYDLADSFHQVLRQRTKSAMKPFFPCTLSLSVILCLNSPVISLRTSPFPTTCRRRLGVLPLTEKAIFTPVCGRGDIVVTKPGKDPHAIEWKIFATGLHNPMGMQWVGPGRLVVSQMAELTEVIDTDGDGVADRYVNLSTAFGISGNYHETNAICPDGEGGYYVALGHRFSQRSHLFLTPRRILEAGPKREEFFVQPFAWMGGSLP